MARRFEGKSVFITGASSGIGAALGIEFAKEGARVALAARREDKLEEVRTRITGMGGRAIIVPCDVTDRASLDHAVVRAAEAFGGLDVAVANAGFGVNGAFEGLSTDDFRRQFDTNVFGAIDTVYAVLPHLIQSRGRLVLVSSVFGRLGAPTSSAYCASKFALCGLAESIDYELASSGVSVTCISPGVVASNFRMVDNANRFHPDLSDPAPPFLIVPTEKAARHMVRAIYRRRFEAVITFHGKLGVFLNRHFPRTFRRLFRLAAQGRMEKLEQDTPGQFEDQD